MSNMNHSGDASRKKVFESKRDFRGRRSKGFNLVLAIIIAVGLWVYVINAENPTTQEAFTGVPVQLLNEETLAARGLALLGDGEYTVKVTMEGKRGDFQNITADDIVATADLFGYSQGENHIMVNVVLPSDSKMTLVETRPARITVDIDTLATVSKEVSVRFEGSIPGGHELGRISVSPSEVAISGPQSMVDQVATVEVVVPVDSLTDDGDVLHLEAVPLNAEGLRVENVKLSTTYVDYGAVMFSTKEVEVEIPLTGALPEGYIAEADETVSVVVRGSESALRRLDTLMADPIDISSLTEGKHEVALNITLPDGVELTRGYKNIKVPVVVKAIQSMTFSYNSGDIRLANLTADQSVDVPEQEFLLTVTGERALMETLAADDFLLSIDLADVSAGEYTAPVSVDYRLSPEPLSVVLEPASVNIVVTEKE